MMSTFMRDLSFFIACLLLYDVFMLKGVIHASEAAFLLGFVFIYIFIILHMNKRNDKKSKRKRESEERIKEEN